MAFHTAQAPSPLARQLARRQTRRGLVTFLVVLVVLGVLFEAADLISRHVAADTIASRAQKASDAQSAGASISGWPFLVNLAGGNVRQVDVDLHAVPVGGLEVSELEVVLTGIGIDRNALFANRSLRISHIGSASVRAVVTAGELTTAVGDPVTLKPDGTIQVVVAGRSVTAQVALVGGHVLVLEYAGRQLLRADLARDRLVPECKMDLAVTSQAITTTCVVSPVPQRVLTALSGAASS